MIEALVRQNRLANPQTLELNGGRLDYVDLSGSPSGISTCGTINVSQLFDATIQVPNLSQHATASGCDRTERDVNDVEQRKRHTEAGLQ